VILRSTHLHRNQSCHQDGYILTGDTFRDRHVASLERTEANEIVFDPPSFQRATASRLSPVEVEAEGHVYEPLRIVRLARAGM
jgi:hypothetical protein